MLKCLWSTTTCMWPLILILLLESGCFSSYSKTSHLFSNVTHGWENKSILFSSSGTEEENAQLRHGLWLRKTTSIQVRNKRLSAISHAGSARPGSYPWWLVIKNCQFSDSTRKTRRGQNCEWWEAVLQATLPGMSTFKSKVSVSKNKNEWVNYPEEKPSLQGRILQT